MPRASQFLTIFSVLFVFVSLLRCSSTQSGDDSSDESFVQWKQQHSRRYESTADEQQRRQLYQSTLSFINEHNSQSDTTYKMRINQFADKSVSELRLLNGNRHTNDKFHNLHSSRLLTSGRRQSDIPQAIDWRQKGAVTPVQHQGNCGSCWAFSAAGAIEGQLAIKYNKRVTLSKQFLVDCDNVDSGCNGGWVMNAYNFVSKEGIASEDDYPYTAREGHCRSSSVQSAIDVTDTSKPGQYLPQDEDAIAAAVATIGPLSAAINGDDRKFYYYGQGVYRSSTCDKSPNDVDHAVLIVGYNNTKADGGPYWIVKNSWGTHYGEKGFVRMAKGVNQCGIANWVMYPTLNINS